MVSCIAPFVQGYLEHFRAFRLWPRLIRLKVSLAYMLGILAYTNAYNLFRAALGYASCQRKGRIIQSDPSGGFIGVISETNARILKAAAGTA